MRVKFTNTQYRTREIDKVRWGCKGKQMKCAFLPLSSHFLPTFLSRWPSLSSVALNCCPLAEITTLKVGKRVRVESLSRSSPDRQADRLNCSFAESLANSHKLCKRMRMGGIFSRLDRIWLDLSLLLFCRLLSFLSSLFRGFYLSSQTVARELLSCVCLCERYFISWRTIIIERRRVRRVIVKIFSSYHMTA